MPSPFLKNMTASVDLFPTQVIFLPLNDSSNKTLQLPSKRKATQNLKECSCPLGASPWLQIESFLASKLLLPRGMSDVDVKPPVARSIPTRCDQVILLFIATMELVASKPWTNSLFPVMSATIWSFNTPMEFSELRQIN